MEGAVDVDDVLYDEDVVVEDYLQGSQPRFNIPYNGSSGNIGVGDSDSHNMQTPQLSQQNAGEGLHFATLCDILSRSSPMLDNYIHSVSPAYPVTDCDCVEKCDVTVLEWPIIS